MNFKKLFRFIASNIFSWDLKMLALVQGTDKGRGHNYIKYYKEHFRDLRRKKLKILEIGVGGDEDISYGGASLRMWKYYFGKSMIYSIDIHDKSALEEKKIKIFRGDQSDESFLKDVYKKIGSLDIIIDDGSHMNQHVISTFKTLFPLLKEGGIYVIEDIQTSYWPKYGGDSDNLNNPATSMNFFKSLTDCLNHKEFIRPNYTPTDFDKSVVSIHFYHNLVFIYKGINDERSNKQSCLNNN